MVYIYYKKNEKKGQIGQGSLVNGLLNKEILDEEILEVSLMKLHDPSNPFCYHYLSFSDKAFGKRRFVFPTWLLRFFLFFNRKWFGWFFQVFVVVITCQALFNFTLSKQKNSSKSFFLEDAIQTFSNSLPLLPLEPSHWFEGNLVFYKRASPISFYQLPQRDQVLYFMAETEKINHVDSKFQFVKRLSSLPCEKFFIVELKSDWKHLMIESKPGKKRFLTFSASQKKPLSAVCLLLKNFWERP
jgi:hypothetical protein